LAEHTTDRRLGRLLCALLLAVTLGGCDWIDEHMDYQLPGWNKGYAPKQPIPYSHRLHAGELKIECQYCHHGAEKARHAGIPSVNVCMNCHKMVKTDSPHIKKIHAAYESGKSIEWVKIHNVPDFVHFDHSRHVNRGVACQTCHGAIETMEVVAQANTLSMGWCVNCHRKYKDDPPEHLKDKNLNPSIDCSACHY
jgi:DNA-directed RNA polymerase subunit RPC12/RpoP